MTSLVPRVIFSMHLMSAWTTASYNILRRVIPRLKSVTLYLNSTEQAIEQYVTQIQSFNIANKPRIKWQNGTSANGRYSISHRLLIPCTPSQHKKSLVEDWSNIHPWLTAAAQSTKTYMLNLPFPVYFDFCDGKRLVELKNSDPPHFSKGDIVFFTFRLGFYVGDSDWRPEIFPDEFIRVEKDESIQQAARSTISQWPTGDIRRRLIPGKVSQTVQCKCQPLCTHPNTNVDSLLEQSVTKARKMSTLCMSYHPKNLLKMPIIMTLTHRLTMTMRHFTRLNQ